MLPKIDFCEMRDLHLDPDEDPSIDSLLKRFADMNSITTTLQDDERALKEGSILFARPPDR